LQIARVDHDRWRARRRICRLAIDVLASLRIRSDGTRQIADRVPVELGRGLVAGRVEPVRPLVAIEIDRGGGDQLVAAERLVESGAELGGRYPVAHGGDLPVIRVVQVALML
jgi:hypothetical protein